MSAMQAQADALKAKLKDREASYDQDTRIRIHRAVSWLRRAEAEAEDLDARFIFLWIAFNAAYAQAFGFEQTERELLRQFLARLLSVDSEQRLHRLIFEKFTGPVRVLIDNRFVFEPFWRALREHDSSDAWKQQFTAGQKAALRSVMGQDTLVVLGIVFDRLYVLRNQLVHGGATWNGRVNRQQVGDGASLLGDLVPITLELMLEHPEVDYGGIAFPVV
ncbi:MAG: hypothetical protein ACT4QA_07750 [Panacagrimonas sp.]